MGKNGRGSSSYMVPGEEDSSVTSDLGETDVEGNGNEWLWL